MFLQPVVRKVYAYSEAVDMRKSFNGLIALTRDVLREDPLSGNVYVFSNRARNIVKCLVWDRTGFVVVGKLLGNYKGVLLADGHDAYDKYAARHAEVVRAHCWVHTRRNFFELDGPGELREGALDRIGRMYEVEERIRKKKLLGEAKVAYRGEHAKPIVEEFFEWLAEVSRERMLLPTAPFLKAVVYALKRKDALRVYLSHPDVPMDTNHEERALRVIPMGRRNYLFCWSELGAVSVGRIQSLLVTCKLHEVDPYTYLVDVLQRIQTHPFSEVALLTPRLWKKYFAQDPMVSPLEMLRRQKYADASKKMG